MAFYLNLRKSQEFKHNVTYKFIQQKITLGEDITNNLRLFSRTKLISPIHAEINIKNGKYYIVDMGSENGTFISEERLEQNKLYPLEDGSEFQIGEYFIIFLINEKNIKEKYSNKMSILNQNTCFVNDLEQLNWLIEREFSQSDDANIVQSLYESLSGRDVEGLRSLLDKLNQQHKDRKKDEELLHSDNTDFILDMFFTFFIKLFEISIQISHEFIDTHTIHRKDSKILLSPERLKAFILANNLSPEEREKRQQFLKVEVDDLISRHIALFAGYRNSIKYGLKEILNKLDPTTVMKDELNQTLSIGPFKISRKYIPFFIYRKVFDNVVMNHELISKYEQKEVVEKYFKSAFISGFLQSINSDRVPYKNNNGSYK